MTTPLDGDADGGALSGIRVIDVSRGVAGSYAAKLFADFGADVVKVEPPEGDPTRAAGPFAGHVPHPEKSALFLYLNTNKRSVTLDLHAEAGAQALRRLALSADVLIEDLKPGTLAALGLSYADLSAQNPGLVFTSITGFGSDGPYRDFETTHLVNAAFGGWMADCGDPDREPIQSGGRLSEYAAGTYGASGTLAAYYARRADGSGQRVEVSIQDAVQILTIFRAVRYQYTGVLGRRSGTHFPMGILPCRDGYVGCGVIGGQWPLLCAMIGRPDLADEPRFAGGHFALRQHHEELEEILTDHFRAHGADELFHEGQTWRVTTSLVPTVDELLEFEQHRAREYFVEIDHAHAGVLRYPRAPFRLEQSPAVTPCAAPQLGEHNRSILCDELGLTTDELLRAIGDVSVKQVPRAEITVAPPLPPSIAARDAARGTRPLPLRGIRVIDLTWVMAGPAATLVLADLGADVIKVESIQRLDSWRGAPQSAEQNPGFNTLNRNKRGITLDLGSRRGAALFRSLVRDADMVTENYTPRVMSNFGLDYESLLEVNPDLIMLSMPGYGSTGPWKDFVSFAPSTEEMAGIAQLSGYAGGPPMLSGGGIGDPLAGLNGSNALLMALEYRRRTGRGQHIDLSQVEACTHLIGEVVLGHQLTGEVPARRGNSHPSMAPHGAYRCLGDDAWVAIAVRSDEEWARFVRVLGTPGLAKDERFATTAARLAHEPELNALVEAWTRTQRHYAVARRLQAAGIPAGPVLNSAELLLDPNLGARGSWEHVERAGDGGYWYPHQPIRLSGSDTETRVPAPTMGQHNGEILGGLLGLSPGELEELAAAEVIGTKPLTR